MIFDHRTYWVPKDIEDRQAYQDAFEADPDRGLASVADGAASSLFSGRWAKLLVEYAVREPITPDSSEFTEWLRRRREAWREPIDEEQLAWHQKAKLREGAHATWLWLGLHRDETTHANEWKFTAHGIGDCCLFLVRDEQSILIFPVTSSESFSDRPATLASGAGSEARIKDSWKLLEGSCQTGDTFVLTSDALAAWGVRELETQRQPDWGSFWDISSWEFEQRIKEMRNDNKIRYDDTTLLLLRVLEPPSDPDQLTKLVDGIRKSWGQWASGLSSTAQKLRDRIND